LFSVDRRTEAEYNDGFYNGVPESWIEQRVGEEVSLSRVEWLERIGEVRHVADDLLVFCD